MRGHTKKPYLCTRVESVYAEYKKLPENLEKTRYLIPKKRIDCNDIGYPI